MTTTTTPPKTEWASLPNAKHIDSILANMRTNPHNWCINQLDGGWRIARKAVRHPAQDDIIKVGRDDIYKAVKDEVWHAAYDVADAVCVGDCGGIVWGDARNAAWAAASDAVCALIAWDDAGALLNMPTDTVLRLASGGENPAALLLIQAHIALNNISNTLTE